MCCIVDSFLSKEQVPANRNFECDRAFILLIFIIEKKLAAHKIMMGVIRVGSLFVFILIIQCKYAYI